MYKLSVGSWAFLSPPNPWPLHKVCEYLSELKYDGVELFGGVPHASPGDCRTKEERANLLSMIRGYGLGISNFSYQATAPSPYDSLRNYHKPFDLVLGFCRDLDIRKISSVWRAGYADQQGMDYGAATSRIVSVWKGYSKKAEDSGILLTWEFDPGFFINRPTDILRAVEEVGSPNFAVLFDTCHAHACAIGLRQTPPLDLIDVPPSKVAAEFMRRLKGRIGHVHLIDNNNTLNAWSTSSHTPFGKGVIDFDEVMKALPEAGYREGWLTIDCEEEAVETAKSGKGFIDGLLVKHGYK